MNFRIVVGICVLVFGIVMRLVALSAQLQIRADLEMKDPEIQRRSMWLDSFYFFGDLKRHKQLFPESTLSKRFIVCVAFFFIGGICGLIILLM